MSAPRRQKTVAAPQSGLRRQVTLVLLIGATIAGLGVAVLVIAARSPERRVARLLTEALIHRRTQRLDLEAATLEQALEIMPTNAGVRAKLGRNARARGDVARAETLLREAVAGNPDDLAAGFDLFEVLVERGKLEEADDLMTRIAKQSEAVSSEGVRDRVRAGRATLALRRGDEAAAARELEEALGANPAEDAAPRISLATIRASEGAPDKAEELVRSIWDVRRPRNLPAAHTEEDKLRDNARYATDEMAGRAATVLGRLLLARGAADEAAQVLAEARDRVPGDADIALGLADALLASGRRESTVELAKALEEKGAHGLAALVRGKEARARGDRDAARAAFNEAVQAAPGEPGPALAAAASALEAEDKEDARRLVLAIDLSRASLDDRIARCDLLRALGDDALALAELEPVLATAPGHPAGIDLLLRIHMEKGRPEVARRELDRLLARAPGNRVILRARSVLALWNAETGKAIELSRDVVSSSGGVDPGAVEVLAAALAVEGGVGTAVKELESLASGARDEGVRVKARLQAAELYRALGRADLAVPVLERGLKEGPGSRELRLALARGELALGGGQRALATLAPLLDGGGDPDALVLAASAARAEKRPRDAIAFARRAQGDRRLAASALGIEALAAREAADLASARVAFAKLRELEPGAALGYVGAILDLLDRPADAVPILREAVARTGSDAFALDLALALDLSAGAGDEAVKLARESFEKGSSRDETAAYVYAAALSRRGRSDEAGSVLARAGVPGELRLALLALHHEDLAGFETLLELARHGFDREAAELARKLAAKCPGNVAVALQAGRALVAAGEPGPAVTVLEAALSQSPRFTPCRLELGYARRLTALGREGAVDAFAKGVELAPEESALQLALGVAEDELGRTAQAEKAYRAVLRLDPKNAVAQNNLAWILLTRATHPGEPAATRARLLDEALAFAQASVQEQPRSPQGLDTLGRIELARGEPRRAIEHADRAIAAGPLDVSARVGYAQALDALGRSQEAANQYEVALLLSASFDGREAAEKRLGELRAALGRKPPTPGSGG
jgi:tetratricopeptide (TPR) repeat protein